MASFTTNQITSVGRRKSAVARVYLKKGSGKFSINNKTPEVYFALSTNIQNIMRPLVLSKHEKSFDIKVNVGGGGYNGQSDAIKLGIARALLKYDESLRQIMRTNKLLTRDARVVERKKYGQKGARKKFQFSKR